MWTKFIRRFSMYDLVIIAMVASLGIASKPVVVPLAHMITGPLMIPGGVVAGGFYMMWLVLGRGLTGKIGSASLIGLVQAVLTGALGMLGSHGAATLITYTIPGLCADLAMAFGGRRLSVTSAFLGGMAANMAGTALTSLVFFRLPFVPLMLSLSAAALSGAVGGITAHLILKRLFSLMPQDFHAENWEE